MNNAYNPCVLCLNLQPKGSAHKYCYLHDRIIPAERCAELMDFLSQQSDEDVDLMSLVRDYLDEFEDFLDEEETVN